MGKVSGRAALRNKGEAELTMGPHWFKSIVYDWSLGGAAGSSGFWFEGLAGRYVRTKGGLPSGRS